MSANKENNLVQAYIELNKFCQGGDYDRALKAAGKILQVTPNEQKAFHCKVICFIQLHNFKEALAVLTNPKNAALAADLHFEKAYAQYRLNCPNDALQTVDNAPEMTLALKELRAQILYRLEQYQDCYNLYRDIVKNTTDDYEDERKTNMAAVVANLGALNPSADLPQFDENTYELAYNNGSTLAMRGKYNEALPVLKRSEQACSESVLEDGGTEEEAKEEAAIIRVQQAYCLQQIGREKEAATIYQNVLKDKPSDQALVAIASNNLVVINRDTNVFDSRKRMKAATAEGLEHKLNSRQRAAITYNQAILAIYSNQPDFCKQCCVKLTKTWKQEQRAALVEASSLVKEGKKQQAVQLLLKEGGTLTLAAAQVLLAHGDRKATVKLLEESEFKHRPGVVGVLATLLCADNELDKASQLFTDVYEHYKNDERFTSLRAVWQAAAAVHLRAGRRAAAAGAHEAAARAAPGDARSLARLVKALAQADPARARQLAERLPAPATVEVSTAAVHLRAGRRAAAAGAHEAAARAAPGDARSLARLVKALAQADPARARQLAERLPAPATVEVSTAAVHLRAGRRAAAAGAHEAAARAAPGDARSLARLVKALAQADPARARQLAERLPAPATVEVSTAAVHLRAGRRAAAAGAHEAAARAAPGDARSLARLVKALAQADPARARQLAERLPAPATVEVSTAAVHLRAGRRAAAAGAHEAAARAAPGDARSLARLVKALAQADPARARQLAERLPAPATVEVSTAAVHLRAGRRAAAAGAHEAAARAAPGDARSLARLVKALAQADPARARQLAERLPAPATVEVSTAAVHLRAGRRAAAAGAHEAAARAAPGDARSLARLVKALAQADPARARQLAERLPAPATVEVSTAAVHLRAGRRAAAAGAHEAAARAAPGDARSLARLVKALAQADPARARQLAERLPAPATVEGKIDIEALETSKWMMGAKVVKKTVQSKQEQSPGTPGSELGTKRKQKRKRKTKLPPTADLSRPPDPERWLPKYERAAYRKRRGARRDVIKGSQGMSTAATDQYDMSKQAPSAAAAKSPRADKPEKDSAWQRKQQQKKKGKGRKW